MTSLRRRVGAISVAVGVAALVLGLTASPAHAAPPEKVGWWFQALSGPLALPVPAPVVPAGGMFVQQGATADPLAIAAIRYAVADGSSNAVTLTAAPGSVALTASMQACKTTSSWEATPTGPGSWDARPSYGSPCAPGSVASDGSAVVFNLNPAFVSNGALDVAIVPLTAATPFAVAFAPPDGDSLQSATGKASTSPTLPTATTTAGAAVPSGGSSRPSVATPVVSGGAPVAPPAAPAPTATNTSSAVAENVLNVVGLGDADRGARMASLGGASLIVVGWWMLSTRAVPMPRLLGGVAAGARASEADDLPGKVIARIGGVGRFARTRAANPLKLR